MRCTALPVVKRIEAFIKRYKLEDVRAALAQLDLAPGLTVTEVNALRHPSDDPDGAEDPDADGRIADDEAEVKLEVVVSDTVAGWVVEVVERTGSLRRRADGRIVVTPVEDVVRVRTGEHGHPAL